MQLCDLLWIAMQLVLSLSHVHALLQLVEAQGAPSHTRWTCD
jgi:hypothetical protein